jgi:hypothetical protein
MAPSEVGLSVDDLAGLRIAQQAVLSGLRSPDKKAQAFGPRRTGTQARVLNTLQGLSRDSIIQKSKSTLVPERLLLHQRKTRHKFESLAPLSCQLSAIVEIAELWVRTPHRAGTEIWHTPIKDMLVAGFSAGATTAAT